jgi:hypothetical protein
LGLGLAALIGLSAPEARAATMTMNVIFGGSTFSFTGTATSVAPSLTVINGDLAGSGYSFSSLGGSSNNVGTPALAFVSESFDLDRTGGTGGPLVIQVTEGGFTDPASATGNSWMVNHTATFTGDTATSSQTNVGNFTDSGAVNVNLSPVPSPLFGTTSAAQSGTATHALSPYAIPFTLTTTTTINLAQVGTSDANDVGTSTVSVAGVPEPASLILMLTGMPLPLVVMGLLRRRRRAAA